MERASDNTFKTNDPDFPHGYNVQVGGKSIPVYAKEPLTVEEQGQAALLKMKSQSQSQKSWGDKLAGIGVNAVRTAALPIIGGGVGAMGGMALGGPWGAVAGMSAGGALGEAANQYLGVTPRSAQDIVLAGAPVGGATHLGGRVARETARNAPGVAPALRQGIMDRVESTVESVTPTQAAVSDLKTQARASAQAAGPAVYMPALDAKILEIENQLAKVAQKGSAHDAVRRVIHDLRANSHARATTTDLINAIDHLGEEVRRIDTPAIRSLYQAAMTDFRTYADKGHQAFKDALKANSTARQQYELRQLGDVANTKAAAEQTSTYGAPQAWARNYLKKRDELVKVLPPDIITQLDKVADQARWAPRGSSFGIPHMLGASTGLLGGGLYSHDPLQTLAGGLAGIVGGSAAAGLPAALGRDWGKGKTMASLNAAYQAAMSELKPDVKEKLKR